MSIPGRRERPWSAPRAARIRVCHGAAAMPSSGLAAALAAILKAHILQADLEICSDLRILCVSRALTRPSGPVVV